MNISPYYHNNSKIYLVVWHAPVSRQELFPIYQVHKRRLSCQRDVSQTWLSNCTQQNIAGCNYLSPAWGTCLWHPSHQISTHYNDVIMGAIASQITSHTVVYSAVYSVADQRKHQSSVSLAFVRGIHRWPVIYPHKGPVTRKMYPFDDVIMRNYWLHNRIYWCTVVSSQNMREKLSNKAYVTFKSFIIRFDFMDLFGTLFAKGDYLNPLHWRHNERDGVSKNRVSIVCSTVCLRTDQRKHESSASLALWK